MGELDMKHSATLQEVDKIRRDKLNELLAQCTEAERGLFQRMYGTCDAHEMPYGKIDWAVRQVENTLAKKKAKEAD